jgi:hypothetical protein
MVILLMVILALEVSAAFGPLSALAVRPERDGGGPLAQAAPVHTGYPEPEGLPSVFLPLAAVRQFTARPQELRL